MTYKLLSLLAAALLLFSPALAEMPEAETEMFPAKGKRAMSQL